jgi:hypothetical protein
LLLAPFAWLVARVYITLYGTVNAYGCVRLSVRTGSGSERSKRNISYNEASAKVTGQRKFSSQSDG